MDSDDDDFGPAPAADPSTGTDLVPSSGLDVIPSSGPDVATHQPKKKRRVLDHEDVFLAALPSSTQYEKSYMHRDIVSHIAVARATDFIVTGSIDGHVKLWKKMSTGIEFVKHFVAHTDSIRSLEVSPDGCKVVTSSADKMIKVFEVQSFDMINMIRTCEASETFTPGPCVWLMEGQSNVYGRIAVSDLSSGDMRVYRVEDPSSNFTLLNIHSAPVVAMSLNVSAKAVVSIDAKGMLEYWDTETFELPSKRISFERKTDTDLYDIAKSRSRPCCLAVAPSGERFVVSTADRLIRVFDFCRGKLLRKYDESIAVYQTVEGMEEAELARRLQIEKELASNPELLNTCNVAFDESSNFIVYASLVGIKLLNIATSKVSRVVGSAERERFTAVALYQGVPKVDNQFLLSRAGNTAKSSEEMTALAETADPTVFAAAVGTRRFYCLSGRLPDETNEARDVFNELPTEEEKIIETLVMPKNLGREAILRTNHGDITIKLFAAECPKTIENFCTHAKNGYYDNTIFHRIIKGFMVQCGDPAGDGTGGESIWGGEFEDEFVRTLRHDRAYTVSMANSGPNTNGSQFFITTVSTPWLDNKHTVFGRVTKGFEVVANIENLRTSKVDRPVEGDPKILSVDINR